MKLKLLLCGVLFGAMNICIQAQDSNSVSIQQDGKKIKISGVLEIPNEAEISNLVDSILGITNISLQKIQQELGQLDIPTINLDSIGTIIKNFTSLNFNNDTTVLTTNNKILLGIMVDDYNVTQDLKNVHPIISNVISNSPAEEAGLLKNDIIFKVDQEEVNLISEIVQIISSKNEGDSLHIEFIRNSDTLNTIALLRLVPQNDDWLTLLNQRISKIDSSLNKNTPFCEKIIIQKSGPRLGVSVKDLNEDSRNRLKVKTGGALITKVIENTTAQIMKLQIDDVITEVNGLKIQNISELKTLIDALPIPNDIRIKYVRNGKKKSAKGTISEFSKAWDDNNVMDVIDLSQFFNNK